MQRLYLYSAAEENIEKFLRNDIIYSQIRENFLVFTD